MNNYLTLDIGGTDLKYGVITENEKLILKDLTPTNGHLGVKNLMSIIKKLFINLNEKYNLKGLSISSTGAFDSETNMLIPSIAIKDYQYTNIKKELASLGVPISVENDVNSMGLCEVTYIPNYQNLKCMVTMTLGTGIGGAIFINNKLHRGYQFTAGEWGKFYTNQDLISYENMASVSQLVRNAQAIYPNIENGVDVYQYYDNGDVKIAKVVDNFYHQVALGIANIVYTLNPEHIVIGGGVTSRGEKFLDELKVKLKPLLVPNLFSDLGMSLAVNGNDAGMIGAFKHFKNLFLK